MRSVLHTRLDESLGEPLASLTTTTSHNGHKLDRASRKSSTVPSTSTDRRGGGVRGGGAAVGGAFVALKLTAPVAAVLVLL